MKGKPRESVWVWFILLHMITSSSTHFPEHNVVILCECVSSNFLYSLIPQIDIVNNVSANMDG